MTSSIALIVSAIATVGVDPREPIDVAVDAAARLTNGASAEIVQGVARARAAMAAGDYEGARAAACRAVRRSLAVAPGAKEVDEAADAWLQLGLALFRGDRSREAVAAFARSAELRPRSATAQFNLGSAHFEADQPAQAEAHYLSAAELDDKVAPLAWLDAALAAAADGRPTVALRHAQSALDGARRAGSDPLAQRAQALVAALLARGAPGAATERQEVFALARRGKEALAAGRAAAAAEHYRAALALAERTRAQASDRAELDYALGRALLDQGRVAEARRAFTLAAELAPREADFQFMLGTAAERMGDLAEARSALGSALAHGLAGGDAENARARLKALAGHRFAERFSVEARIGGGWDSDVPQSNAVVTVPAGSASASPDAGLLSADLDALYRPFGSTRSGLDLAYRFGQLAYLSSALDAYSLQEHDLTATGGVTLFDRLRAELGVDGYLLFAGVLHFSTFQMGLGLGPRILVEEPHGLETQVRYQHLFKSSLDPSYNYLAGNRDELRAAQRWRFARGRVSAAYTFSSESIGAERVPVAAIVFPLGAPAGATSSTYVIPYSYTSHEASLAGSFDLPWKLSVAITGRYEHRTYDRKSFVYDPATLISRYRHERIDDRVTLDLCLRRALVGRFGADLAYTLVVNRSTIDFTNPATPFDYDNKNYLKHVITAEVSFLY